MPMYDLKCSNLYSLLNKNIIIIYFVHYYFILCNEILREIEFDICIKGRAMASPLLLSWGFGQITVSPLVSAPLLIRWICIPSSDGLGEA